MRFRLVLAVLLVLLACAPLVRAQDSSPGDLLKHDVGAWDAEIKVWEPGSAEPSVSKGHEHNMMIGDYWLISHFSGEMMGMPFSGASYTGYNPDTKKFFGTWIDSMSPAPMEVESTWDDATRTMTGTGVGKGPDGSDMKFKMTTVQGKDGGRVFSMFMIGPDNSEMKTLEITYTRAKDEHSHDHSPDSAPAANKGG